MGTQVTRCVDLRGNDIVLEVRISSEDLVNLDPSDATFKLIREVDQKEIPLSLRLASAAMLVKLIERSK